MLSDPAYGVLATIPPGTTLAETLTAHDRRTRP